MDVSLQIRSVEGQAPLQALGRGRKMVVIFAKYKSFSNSRSTLNLSSPASTIYLPLSTNAQERVTYLPITRSQPPSLPRRSTSLPYYKILKQLKRTQLTNSPQFALSDSRWRDGGEDGFMCRWMVNRICSPQLRAEENRVLRDGIWKTVLQAANKEIGIRHLLLIFGHLHLPQKPTQLASIITRHEVLARHHLNHLFSTSRTPNRQIYETAFIALYLLTYIQLMLKRPQQAREYHRIAFRVLRKAMRLFDREHGEEGDGLPGCMMDAVVAFGRLGFEKR